MAPGDMACFSEPHALARSIDSRATTAVSHARPPTTSAETRALTSLITETCPDLPPPIPLQRVIMPQARQEVELHPNGKAKIAIRDVQRVYGDVAKIPLEAFMTSGAVKQPRLSSMVTPEQVRRASDQWDAEGLLEDIDTQWGMIPEGGALEGYGSD